MTHDEQLMRQALRAQDELRALRTLCRDASNARHSMPDQSFREISNRMTFAGRDLVAAWKHLREMANPANVGLSGLDADLRKMSREAGRHLMAEAVDRLSGSGR